MPPTPYLHSNLTLGHAHHRINHIPVADHLHLTCKNTQKHTRTLPQTSHTHTQTRNTSTHSSLGSTQTDSPQRAVSRGTGTTTELYTTSPLSNSHTTPLHQLHCGIVTSPFPPPPWPQTHQGHPMLNTTSLISRDQPTSLLHYFVYLIHPGV